MGITSRLASESDSNGWNEFITKNTPNAFYSLYNLFEWRRILIHAYGYEPYYIIAEEKGEIAGCFSLMLVKSRLFGNRLISLPFTDHGCGPCVKDGNVAVLKFLLDEARQIAVKKHVQSVKICAPQQFVLENAAEYRKLYDYCTFLISLKRSKDDVWSGLDKRIRNAVRKAQKGGVKVVIDNSEDGVATLHKIHVANMKKLGTPPHSKKFFKVMQSELEPEGLYKAFFAEYKGNRIAAIVVFPHRESVRWGIGGALPKYRELNPINLLLLEAVQWAIDNGYELFDFGGSRPKSGNYFFKTGWMGKNSDMSQIVDLSHLHLCLSGRAEIVDPEKSKYTFLSSVWKKCMPSTFTTLIGPSIRKQLAA
jgi:CelD/BcsL family acetyltransferase involved in cellulose biosynthesis